MYKLLLATAMSLAVAVTAQAQIQEQRPVEPGIEPQVEPPIGVQEPLPAEPAAPQGTEGATVPPTYQVEPGDKLVSRLVGQQVYNRQNERVGTVSDLVLDEQGEVQAYILSVGGFLGIGDHLVAVEPNMVQMMPQAGGEARFVMDATRDTLKAAPAFAMEEATRDATEGATQGATQAPEPMDQLEQEMRETMPQ